MSELTYNIIVCLSAFIASFGFSLVYRLHKNIKFGLIGGAIGGLSWGIYLLSSNLPLYFNYFLCALFVGVMSEFCARIFKTPSTVFILVGIFPSVPGGKIYRTMLHIVNGEIDLFISSLIDTIAVALSIALAILISSTLFKIRKSYLTKKQHRLSCHD